MKLLTIAWTLVAVTWCCDSAIVYDPMVRSTRWYDPRIQDLELLDVSLFIFLRILKVARTIDSVRLGDFMLVIQYVTCRQI